MDMSMSTWRENLCFTIGTFKHVFSPFAVISWSFNFKIWHAVACVRLTSWRGRKRILNVVIQSNYKQRLIFSVAFAGVGNCNLFCACNKIFFIRLKLISSYVCFGISVEMGGSNWMYSLCKCFRKAIIYLHGRLIKIRKEGTWEGVRCSEPFAIVANFLLLFSSPSLASL